MIRNIEYILLLVLAVYQSCDPFITKPIYDDNIQNYIDELNLDSPQQIIYDISVKNEGIYFFHVNYGEPQDCPSGCFYKKIYGLKNNKKVNRLDFYDIDNKDSYLFTDTFFHKVKKYDKWYFYSKFLPILARDEDTPIKTLTKIANSLYTYINPHVGNLLIDNTAVQNNENILIIIANLPVFQGDAYQDIRQSAKTLLEKFG